ncbi:MAG: Rrf2 family transcriptional regulator [Candidatus Omnitrophica bacterium]|nr:Rrf2 family transcriptional regulator [bacterium]MBK7497190.1 Rrf2 family transcriptional regulator [Candidatus Omnitrophota bacterium]MBW7938739.1 Rrf2 family transcriptional regulator [Candidatus Omnitrophota bacterium]MCC6732897.1 Rrf2 family transcriptional regulator [Candidatus Omnitrophota bacterium]MCE7907503.1 Rrf2 family transcriptional regulator [Candidatus Omnitrophica bacterium COP1]
MFNRSTQDAIAAMSRLAEVYDGGKTLLSAEDIAKARKLPRPFVAKILTTLGRAGLVSASRGPGGGFTLARPPGEISFLDVANLFERAEQETLCPYGRDHCQSDAPCTIQQEIDRHIQGLKNFLKKTHFDLFTPKPSSSVESEVDEDEFEWAGVRS